MLGSGVPSGTVTFLFTDVEGSTRLWAEQGADMQGAMALHDRLLREAIETNSGYVFTTAGDSFAAAFGRAADALAAAVAMRASTRDAQWPAGLSIKVRVGLHTGEAHERDGDYFGSAVNRAARLMSAAHGGQIVVSGATRDVLVDVPLNQIELVAIGEHSLKDFDEPIDVFEVLDLEQPERFMRLRTDQPTLGNLPVWLEPLVGRDTDVAAVLDRLDGPGVVTIIGVGGIGKTQLALACAGSRRDEFEHGVWVCELALVGDPDAVASAVAQEIGARQHPGRSMVDSIAEYCRRRRMLLVIDNCEHVLDAAADLLEVLRKVAPRVVVLATSREPLGVDGEQILPLKPLAVDGADSPAVELFVRRADAVAPGIEWDAAELGTIERVCARLDGIPLAIELAAARVRSLGLAEIEQHLDRAFRVLRAGRRSVERHRTLEAAIDWSYEALEDADRVLFDRLSVFAGGVDLATAVSVCSDGELVAGDEVMHLLDNLVAKSLLVSERTDGANRFRMLEPVRQYAEDRLAAGGDAEHTHQRHLAHYVVWAEEWRTEVPITGLGWRHRLEREFANLRSAFDWATATADTESAARIVTALEFAQRFFQMLEIGEWAERTLEMPGIDELPQGPGVALVAFVRCWWQADIPGVAKHLRRAKRMPASEIHAGTPGMDRNLALIREAMARGAGDPRAAIESFDGLDRSDPIVDADLAWLRLAWPHDVLNADWARPVMDAERELLDHQVRATGSALFAAMRHHRRGQDAIGRGDYRAAADDARRGITAALDVGATYFIHFNAVILAQGLSLSGDDALRDLDRLAQTLAEQRDVGQVADQWLLLSGTAGVLHRLGTEHLAGEVLHGMLASQWPSTTPAIVNLSKVLGVPVEHARGAGPAPDLGDLVERSLAAINDHLNRSEPAR